MEPQAQTQKKKTFTIKPKGGLKAPSKIPTTLGEPAKQVSLAFIPVTLGQEVDAALAEWYGYRGLPVPPDEVGLGAKIDAEERERFRAEIGNYEKGLAAAEAAPAGAKPEFGTPEFWAWARKRKKEKDAERAAKGLPPLPTKTKKAAAAT